MYVSMQLKATQFTKNTKRLNKIEKVNNIM